MSNTTLIILSAIFILAGSWFLSNRLCGTSSSGNQFSILDGKFKTNSIDPFTFGISGTKATIPSSSEAEFKKIANHLNKNEDRKLNLLGTYFASEKASSDLGLARADAIKAKLEKLGAPAERISISSQRLNNLQSGDKIYNPVSFEFMDAEVIPEPEVNEAEETVSSVLDPFTLRFNTGESKLKMSDDLRDYLNRALTYLVENPGTVLMVTGHTDNVGSSPGNMKLSRDRAAKVRRFLRNNGVKSAQVKYQGMGETKPIDSNETSEGRQQNRRVEIKIEKE